MHRQKGITLIELLGVLFFVFFAGGWLANIYKIATSDFDAPVTTKLIVRGVGIPLVPLGVFIGYVS